jgi:peptidoglycan/xylan/chitin deacetylase (PgdA/CDA1 family)
MIALFGHDPYAVLGAAAILDSEKIPYRRVDDPGVAGDALLVVAGEIGEGDVPAVMRSRSLVLGGGAPFARALLGVRVAAVHHIACRLPLQPLLWSAATIAIAGRHGEQALRLPLAPVCVTGTLASGTPIATLEAAGGRAVPAIVSAGNCLWSGVDLGTAFAHLLCEGYAPRRPPIVASRTRAMARRGAESLYYAAPEVLRRWVQARAYARLAPAFADTTAQPSAYPADATGWLLVELVKALIIHQAGTLVRLAHWPAPFRSAAAMTHDIEPRRYAYRAGLGRLLDDPLTTEISSTFGLVTQASERHLSDSSADALRQRPVLCHGLTHRGEPVHGRRPVLARLDDAHARLERRLGRPVRGYRSPRLDRSADLLWALDQSGFEHDSSYPDVDRENLAHFGGGVRFNLPFRPPVTNDDASFRLSRCLELPLTAPDCIQPLYAGDDEARLRATVAAKADFVHDTGGLYVALVHAGVFGPQDAARRETHLHFVAAQLRQHDVWLAALDEIAEWWRAREALRLSLQSGLVRVTNTGPTPITGVRVVIERDGAAHTLSVPPLSPHSDTILPIPPAASAPAA